MIARIALGALAAAFLMNLWGMIWWMALPFANDVLLQVPEQEQVAAVLGGAISESGTYYFPGPAEGETFESEAFAKRRAAGPLGVIMFIKDGQAPMDSAVFMLGFAHYFITALVLACLLALALPSLQSFNRRLGAVVLAGGAGVILTTFAWPIWFHTDPAYFNMLAVYNVGSVLVGGLALAAIIKPRVA